jgi:anti-anti-sigma factor
VSELAHLDVEQRPALCLLRVAGEIDISNAEELTAAIEGAVPNDAPKVVVDLSRTTYLDSAGVQLIFLLVQRLNDRRQELNIIVPRDAPIRAVLELTSLPTIVRMQERLEEDEGAGRG